MALAAKAVPDPAQAGAGPINERETTVTQHSPTRHTADTVPASSRKALMTYLSMLVMLSGIVISRLAGEQVRDDRGSDTSEKSFMVILAITLGAAVTAAAIAFVATKTALFK